MTDNEIIKALECCAKTAEEAQSCEGCPLLEFSPDYNECQTELMKQSLDLINRQKAEIESLQTEVKRYKRYYFNHEYDKIKSEAYKEFAERLKTKKFTHKNLGELVSVEDITETLKKGGGSDA